MEKLEIKTADGDWRDITEMLFPHPMHPRGGKTMNALHRNIRAGKYRTGPQTRARRAALAKRAQGFAVLLEATDGVGNLTVTAVRAQTSLNERDRAERARGGRGGTGPTSPNRRLATFGMRVELDDSPDGYHLVGGTVRQRACYRRAVERWVLCDPIAEAAA